MLRCVILLAALVSACVALAPWRVPASFPRRIARRATLLRCASDEDVDWEDAMRLLREREIQQLRQQREQVTPECS